MIIDASLHAFIILKSNTMEINWSMLNATPLDVHAYLVSCIERGKAPTTANRTRDALSSLYEALIVSGALSRNPVSSIKKVRSYPKERPFLDEVSANKLIEQIGRPEINLAVRLMLYTGIRVSELTTLSICHFDLNGGTLTVYGKGRKTRQIPLHKEILLPYLKEYYHRFLSDLDPYSRFFQTALTRRVSPSTVNKALKEASVRLNSRITITSHILRHSFATFYLYKGGKIHELQYLLGHNNLETTAKYLHVNMKSVRFTLDETEEDIKYGQA
jgi:integrase/recombinase XerD